MTRLTRPGAFGPAADSWPDWELAWRQALYGPAGFYRRPEGPAGHFRTASHAAGHELATALHRLARQLGCTAIVDVGAGRGELLTALAAVNAESRTEPELRLFGVDIVARPDRLPPAVGWSIAEPTASTLAPQDARTPTDLSTATDPSTTTDLPAITNPPAITDLPAAGAVPAITGVPTATGVPKTIGVPTHDVPTPTGIPPAAMSGALVIGWELLDVVPGPVLELDDDGVPRVVQVDPATGREKLGQPARARDLAWCECWWPMADLEPGDRLEVGRPRDEFWSRLARQAVASQAGALLAVDYAHQLTNRPPLGSLTGFQAGRAVPPRPDGSMDLTTHVAIDSVAAHLAGRTTPVGSTLASQHAALRDLGVQHRELLDPAALGAFAWLLTPLS